MPSCGSESAHQRVVARPAHRGLRAFGELAVVRHGLDVVALVVSGRLVHAAGEVQQLDLAEVDGMRLALQRDVAAVDELAVDLGGGVVVVDHAAAVLRHLVLEHLLAVHEVRDGARAVHLEFGAHPLLAVERGRRGIQAVILVELALVDDLRAGAAHVGGGARLAVAVAAEQLALDRDRESSGRAAWCADRANAAWRRSCAAPRPGRPAPAGRRSGIRPPAGSRRTDPYRRGVRTGRRRSCTCLVVAHLEQAVLDAEGVAEVVAEIVLGDLRRPARQVLAVEEDDPVFLVGVRIRPTRRLRLGRRAPVSGEQRAERAE